MTTSDPRDILDRIKARAAEATPGPWEAHGHSVYGAREPWDQGNGLARLAIMQMPWRKARTESNAVFIAHARTDVDRLVAALAEVLYELDSIESDLDRYVDDLSSALPTTPEPVIERGFAMIRAERAVVGRVRRAIEDMLNEEDH